MNEKVIDYKRYLEAFFLTILYIVCGGLIIYIIIKLNQKTADYIEILNEVAKLIMALITVVLILLFKGFFGKFNWKSYLKGLFIYMLPLTFFDIYHIVTSVKWVFFEHFERYTEHFAGNFIMLSCICITTAVTEEIIFRCGIFNYLRRENNKGRRAFVK
ncbi:MAG: hypothetical protein IJM37_11875 [Lachnospiraceae bacterium]|nr:hypothetical protein [Lachnospiraceae bacterium]